MDASLAPTASSSTSSIPTLQVDFSWKKWKALITDQANPEEPLYIADFMKIRSPHITIKNASDDALIGTGTLHPVSINADYELHGRKGTLKALKRLHTSYTHLSYNYSDTETPVAMTWASDASFKTWNFICLDEDQLPVAKFSAKPWGVKKLGIVEFMGPKAHLPAAREEALVIGMTLYYTMILRVNNIFNLFGAVIARPGPLDKEAAEKDYSKAVGGTSPLPSDVSSKPRAAVYEMS
ncbi:hypothetical protein B0T10DRAFT_488067 [Thelonectria olida]|uniref:Uncharacterized protein n=1 Tax=Thelonectria olida TaxID=1576542 RepID=A0A9P9ALY7_9HYPO|nr:hypothetical protein B0T10DRAFT_488067 [Thelonectria olida]